MKKASKKSTIAKNDCEPLSIAEIDRRIDEDLKEHYAGKTVKAREFAAELGIDLDEE